MSKPKQIIRSQKTFNPPSTFYQKRDKTPKKVYSLGFRITKVRTLLSLDLKLLVQQQWHTAYTEQKQSTGSSSSEDLWEKWWLPGGRQTHRIYEVCDRTTTPASWRPSCCSPSAGNRQLAVAVLAATVSSARPVCWREPDSRTSPESSRLRIAWTVSGSVLAGRFSTSDRSPEQRLTNDERNTRGKGKNKREHRTTRRETGVPRRKRKGRTERSTDRFYCGTSGDERTPRGDLRFFSKNTRVQILLLIACATISRQPWHSETPECSHTDAFPNRFQLSLLARITLDWYQQRLLW